jgi:hypothetical protein
VRLVQLFEKEERRKNAMSTSGTENTEQQADVFLDYLFSKSKK